MPDHQPARTSAHVLRDLHNYLSEPSLNIDELSEQQIEAELKRRAISPEISFQAIHDLLDEHLATAELSAARQQRVRRLEAVKPTVSVLDGVREKVHKLIQSLNPLEAAAYWSKFESADDEDLQSLYDDLTHLSDNGDDTGAARDA